MTFFSNIKIDNNNLYFELNNNNLIKLSLANALRRIIISEIPLYCIDEDTIEFEENTSMLHNNFLSKRLALIPLNYDEINKYEIEKIEISTNIENDTDHMINIKTSDFATKYNNNMINNILTKDNILFGKLKPGQSIKFTSKIKKSTSKKDGSYFSPVSKTSLTYKQDEKLLESLAKDIENKEYFLFTQGQKHYLKTNNNEPAIYIIDMESIGMIEPKIIVSLSLNVLEEKLELLLQSIEENNENKIQISKSDKLFESYNFLIFDEDHTLGNLITSYLLDIPEIEYSGYIIPHPNDNKLIITTATKMNNTIEGNKKIFVETTQKILEIIKKLENEWKSANSAKPISKKIRIKKN